MKVKYKIGFVTDDKLYGGSSNSGHYVLIRRERGNKAYVNVITSLEKNPYNYTKNKITHIRYGNVKPIPMNACNFPRWSGVRSELIKIDKEDLKYKPQKYVKEIFK